MKSFYLRLMLVFVVLLSVSSCDLREPSFYNISENFDSIDKNKIEQLVNAQSEITINDRTYIFYSTVKRTQKPGWGLPVYRFFYIGISEISIENISSNLGSNLNFIEDFTILEFYMINKSKKFYFSSKNINSKNLGIYSKYFRVDIIPMRFLKEENEYRNDVNDIFVIKLKDKNNKEYFLRPKDEKEDIELDKKIEEIRKKLNIL